MENHTCQFKDANCVKRDHCTLEMWRQTCKCGKERWRTKIDELLKSGENFENLLYKLLLFDKDSEYFKFTGFVTAALLDYEDVDKQISILAINTHPNTIDVNGTPVSWFTFEYNREDLRKMFKSCIEVVGETEDKSFVII